MNEKLEKLASDIIAFDYGKPARDLPAAVGRTARDPFVSDFGADPRRGSRDPFVSDFGEDTYLPHYQVPVHPTAPHQTITVKTPERSAFWEFFFQTLAVIAGGYVVQRYIVPRMPAHPRGIE